MKYTDKQVKNLIAKHGEAESLIMMLDDDGEQSKAWEEEEKNGPKFLNEEEAKESEKLAKKLGFTTCDVATYETCLTNEESQKITSYLLKKYKIKKGKK